LLTSLSWLEDTANFAYLLLIARLCLNIKDGSIRLQYKTDRIGVAVKAKGRSDVSIPLCGIE
jgi:hypothetical protein